MIYRTLAILVSIFLITLNLRLYHPGNESYSPPNLGADVIAQLRFIRSALDRGAGEQMQQLFPEGYFFTYVLYGLSWVEVGKRESPDSPLHQQALSEARWAWSKLDSAQGKAVFSKALDPPHGVFYLGWRSWLLGGILSHQPTEQRNPAEVAAFSVDCAALATAFDRNTHPFLQAYPGAAWPVDSTVAVATLKLHDTLFEPRFEPTIQRWLKQIPNYLDPATDLLSHQVSADEGHLLDGARGTSQSLITRFLSEIDAQIGAQHYRRFRDQLVRPFLGVPGVLEFPGDTSHVLLSSGDVDSGPLLYGFSASATINLVGAAQVNGDAEIADALIPASEAVSLPLTWRGEKRYIFGMLPVSDAFVVWNKSSSRWIGKTTPVAYPPLVAVRWRLPFHAFTLAMLVLLWFPVVRRGRR